MKLSTKIKLEYWQAVCTGAMTTGATPRTTLEAMLTKAIDKMEEELNKLKETKAQSIHSYGKPQTRSNYRRGI